MEWGLRNKSHDSEPSVLAILKITRSFPDIVLRLIRSLVDDSRTHEITLKLGFFQMLMAQTSLSSSTRECSVNLTPTLSLDTQTIKEVVNWTFSH